jgi:hypothetical protein
LEKRIKPEPFLMLEGWYEMERALSKAARDTASKFRNDVNANGVISNTDVSVTKSQVGTSLPP